MATVLFFCLHLLIHFSILTVSHLYNFFVSYGLFFREKANSLKHFLLIYRLVKEKVMYEKEAKQQEEKIEKMKAEDGENYVIKKQVKYI
jgi:hypothetical protein